MKIHLLELTVWALGFIFGPLLGGVLSDPQLIPGASFATPLYFAALISFINAVLLQLFFKETFQRAGKLTLKLHGAITIFISAFTNVNIRDISIIYFIMVFGWSSFYSFISLFLLRVYNFSPLEISLFMAVMGIGFGISNGFLMDYFAQRFSLKSITVYSLAICTILTLILNINPYPLLAWLLVAPLGGAASLAYAALLTTFSNQVDADSQGWVMGISGAIMAFVFGLDGLVVAFLVKFSAKLPIILSMVGLGLAGIAMQFCYKENKKPTVSKRISN